MCIISQRSRHTVVVSLLLVTFDFRGVVICWFSSTSSFFLQRETCHSVNSGGNTACVISYWPGILLDRRKKISYSFLNLKCPTFTLYIILETKWFIYRLKRRITGNLFNSNLIWNHILLYSGNCCHSFGFLVILLVTSYTCKFKDIFYMI